MSVHQQDRPPMPFVTKFNAAVVSWNQFLVDGDEESLSDSARHVCDSLNELAVNQTFWEDLQAALAENGEQHQQSREFSDDEFWTIEEDALRDIGVEVSAVRHVLATMAALEGEESVPPATTELRMGANRLRDLVCDDDSSASTGGGVIAYARKSFWKKIRAVGKGLLYLSGAVLAGANVFAVHELVLKVKSVMKGLGAMGIGVK